MLTNNNLFSRRAKSIASSPQSCHATGFAEWARTYGLLLSLALLTSCTMSFFCSGTVVVAFPNIPFKAWPMPCASPTPRMFELIMPWTQMYIFELKSLIVLKWTEICMFNLKWEGKICVREKWSWAVCVVELTLKVTNGCLVIPIE